MPEWLIVVSRAIMMLAALFLVTKWLGKKQISQLSFFEYVIGITIGSIGAEVITGLDRSFIHGVIGICAFVVLPIIGDKLSMKSKKLRDFLEGKGTVLIQNGNVIENSLKKERYTVDELMELLRKKDVFQLSDVEFAILEPTGDLNILLKKEKQPLTAEDLNITVPYMKEPCTIIMDGVVMGQALNSIGKNEEWVKGELAKQSRVMQDVFIGQVDSAGQLTVDLYDHVIQHPTAAKDQILTALLNRCQADLELFSLASQAEEGMLLYQKNSEKLKKVQHDLKSLNQ
ncbi:DUF421 domain-containing protein [Jeotgalibacillus sp. S-D1]|nr:DUF421 domain-containing protein [Jeotgalibacillus sp. S-D1]